MPLLFVNTLDQRYFSAKMGLLEYFMNEKNLQRLIDLTQKTGDTLIITDKNGKDPVVIMDIAKYEALVDADSVAAVDDFDYAETDANDDFIPPMEMYSSEIPANLTSENEKAAMEESDVNMKSVIKPEQKGEDSFGEEQFYLEPIE